MLYDLTVTLKPAMYRMTAKEQFEKTHRILYELLMDFKVTTIAELTKTHNIHYHSVIEILDIKRKDWIINKLRKYKEFGRLSFEQLRYEQSYKDYIKKDIGETALIIGCSPVVRDHYGIVNCPEDITYLLENSES